MAKAKVPVLIGFIFLIASCTIGSGTNAPDEFINAKEVSVKGAAVHLDSDTILNDPREIWTRGNYLFIQDNLEGKDFSIVDLRNGKLIKRFARSGSDSTTFNISAVNLNILSDNSDLTLFQANPPLRIFRYNIDSLLKPDLTYSPPFHYQLPDKLFFKDIVLINDSIVLGQMGMSSIDNNLFGVLNMRSNELTTGIMLSPSSNMKAGKYFTKNYLPWTRTVMQGEFCHHPTNNKLLAYFSEKGSVVQFFKVTEQNNFESIKSELDYLPSFDVLDHGNNRLTPVLNKDCRYGFNSVTATESKVYALYNGKVIKSNGIDNLLSNTVLVYSWEGKPLQKITLDNPCYAISIDPDNPTTMYALHAFKSVGIYKYSLP